MAYFPVFLSVVYVVRNQEKKLEGVLQEATGSISSTVADYEIIIGLTYDTVDKDGSVEKTKVDKNYDKINSYVIVIILALILIYFSPIGIGG